MDPVSLFQAAFVAWASEQSDILGVALVGSRARGTARPDSDVDLVIITNDRERYLPETRWVSEIGAGAPLAIALEDWGAVQTVRAFFRGVEAELNFADPSWANTDPVDTGTRRVMTDGRVILLDRASLLADLVSALDDASRPVG